MAADKPLVKEYPLKEQLIGSLEILSRSSLYRKELIAIIDQLKQEKVIIPKDDYENIISFTMILMKDMPGLFTKANDKAFKKLCTYCWECLNIQEVKAKSRKSGKP